MAAGSQPQKAAVTPVAECRGCGTKNSLIPAFDLGILVNSDFVSPTSPDPVSGPMVLSLCKNCRLVQLSHTIDPDLLFRYFHYRSSITQTMRQHLDEIAKSVAAEANLTEIDYVLDIGANDGTLLSSYPNGVHKIGIDPAKNLSSECAKHADEVISDYFPSQALNGKKFQAITAISMFYDVERPLAFLQAIHDSLSPPGVFCVQMNYLNSMVANNAFDNICFEHLTYFNLTTLSPMLRRAGLFPFKVSTNDLNGGSFRVYCSKGFTHGMDGSVEAMLLHEARQPYGEFEPILRMASRIDSIRTKVRSVIADNPGCWVLGASTRGNTALQYFGLTRQEIVAAGERDAHKWGLEAAGSRIPIRSEQEMRDEAKMVLVLPWHFKREIVAREADFLGRGGRMLFALPEPVIVTKDGERRL